MTTIATVVAGRALTRAGRLEEGFARLDEAMLTITDGPTWPRATSAMYCACIGTCHEAWELARANEWSVALGDWLDDLPRLGGLYFRQLPDLPVPCSCGGTVAGQGLWPSSSRPVPASPRTAGSWSGTRGTSSASRGACSVSQGCSRPTSEPQRSVTASSRVSRCTRLVTGGRTNAQIAAELYLSERTVHRQVSSIFTKLDVHSYSAAAAYVVQHDLT